MHIVISVKDFKAIVTHAETLRGPISAHFSFPTRPLQFSYQNSGMHCDFTLMTTGDYRNASSTPNPNFISNRSASRQSSIVPPPVSIRQVSEMPPPPARAAGTKPFSRQNQRSSLDGQTSHPQTAGSDPDSESLFIPGAVDDQTWDPPNFEPEEEEEMLGWDASLEHPSNRVHPTFRDSGTAAPQNQQPERGPAAFQSQEGLEPTQRLSQVNHCPAPANRPRLTLTATRHVRLRAF